MAKRVELPEFLADRVAKAEERLLAQFAEVNDRDENGVSIEVRDGQEFFDPNRRDDEWYDVLWEVRIGRGKRRYFYLKRPCARDSAWEAIVSWRAWNHAAESWRKLARKVDLDTMGTVATLIEAVGCAAWTEGVTEKVDAQMVDTMEAVREEIADADAELRELAEQLTYTERKPAPACKKCGGKTKVTTSPRGQRQRYLKCTACGFKFKEIRLESPAV